MPPGLGTSADSDGQLFVKSQGMQHRVLLAQPDEEIEEMFSLRPYLPDLLFQTHGYWIFPSPPCPIDTMEGAGLLR